MGQDGDCAESNFRCLAGASWIHINGMHVVQTDTSAGVGCVYGGVEGGEGGGVG